MTRVNFKLGDLARVLMAAGRAGTPVREVLLTSGGGMRVIMDAGPIGPPTADDLAEEVAEADRLVAADKPDI